MSRADFDWHGEEVVVQEQAAIAVYENVHGGIVVRQQADWHSHEDDIVIVVRPDRAVALAKAILRLADELGAIAPTATPLALPSPMTPAERQRRHRNAKRHGAVTSAVTQRETTTSADLFEPA